MVRRKFQRGEKDQEDNQQREPQKVKLHERWYSREIILTATGGEP